MKDGRRTAETLVAQLTGHVVAGQLVLRHKNLATKTAFSRKVCDRLKRAVLKLFETADCRETNDLAQTTGRENDVKDGTEKFDSAIVCDGLVI
jgi:hypothetical protein